MKRTSDKLLIKNMVCPRCIMAVENVLRDLHIPVGKVVLGEADLLGALSREQREQLDSRLRKLGFELIESRIRKIVEDIRKAVIEYIGLGVDADNIKLSSFITQRIPNDYSYLSDLFSSVEGKTIEQFFIGQRIEKVKELLVYDQLSLTEIAYRTGFSSVHHLSAQFKKVTGLTPSHFRKIGAAKRQSIDLL